MRARLAEFRVPLDPAHAARELELAAPREYRPDPDCGGETRGVAILVHGLADTAYSLADVAATLAGECLVARTMLLPGHGTRAADLLEVDHEDWLASVRHLVAQAREEHGAPLLVGVSLGAILGLAVALEPDSGVGALVSISPGWRLESARLVRFTPWLRHLWRWVDEGARDDWARYEAMPMNGIAETWLAVRALDERVARRPGVEVPWLVVQSGDDAIVDGAANRALFESLARSPESLLLEFRTEAGDAARRARGETVPSDAYGTALAAGDGDETGRDGAGSAGVAVAGAASAEAASEAPPLAGAAPRAGDGPRTVLARGDDPGARVTAVTHLGVHVSPDNPHWGADGDFRACGASTPREPAEVDACERAVRPWFTGASTPAPPGEPSARGTFNPHYATLARTLGAFVDAWLETSP